MPDLEARKQIFRLKLESLGTKFEISDEELELFAEKTEGYTGSDICCIVKDAAMEPVREIQKATHFRTIEKPSDNPDDRKDYQYVVCSPDHTDAIAMTFTDLLSETEDRLYQRPLNKEDLLKSISNSRPSVDEETLQKLNKFTKDFVGL